MMFIGLDDTDVVDHPGTNQLARHIVRSLDGQWIGRRIVRHQLFFDPRIPYTSKNGCASIWIEPRDGADRRSLIDRVRQLTIDWCPAGSDPGLCIAEHVPQAISDYGVRCQHEITTQDAARSLAASHGVHLEGLGGTEDGVIGALAAVGLAAIGSSGRVIHLHDVPHDLYDMTGHVTIELVHRYGVDAVWNVAADELVTHGIVDILKRLRPNLRDGQTVLYVEPAPDAWCDLPCWQTARVD